MSRNSVIILSIRKITYLVGLAEEVRKQKLSEAQSISEAVLDAEVRIGELMKALPKEQGKRTDLELGDSGVPKLKAIEDAGFSKKQAQRFEQLASNPELVERAKAEARISSHGSPYKTS